MQDPFLSNPINLLMISIAILYLWSTFQRHRREIRLLVEEWNKERKEDIRKAVYSEIKLLKKRLTQQETDRLSYESFEPYGQDTCLYGQMTGNCFSERARDLIEECSPFLSFTKYVDLNSIVYRSPVDIEEEDFNYKNLQNNRNYSPLEYWIVNYPQDNRRIINFLKGKYKTLRLSKV